MDADTSKRPNDEFRFQTASSDSDEFKKVVAKNNSFASRQIMSHMTKAQKSKENTKPKKFDKDKFFEDLLNAKSQNEELGKVILFT